MLIEPPRQVRDFTIIEPSGRRFRVRYPTRLERVRAFATMCMLLIVSGMLWLAQLAWVWRVISNLFHWGGFMP